MLKVSKYKLDLFLFFLNTTPFWTIWHWIIAQELKLHDAAANTKKGILQKMDMLKLFELSCTSHYQCLDGNPGYFICMLAGMLCKYSTLNGPQFASNL